MAIYTTNSAEETVALGRALARKMPKQAVVLLIGNLGAGKTTLAKGIVSELTGTDPDEISSPTFTLIHEYGAGVYHIDLYRLDSLPQVATLGIEEIFERPSIVLIEWGERFLDWMPPERIEIRLEAIPTETHERRRIEVTEQSLVSSKPASFEKAEKAR